MRCGHCKTEGVDLEHVKKCSGVTLVERKERSWAELGGGAEATPRQRDYLRSLLENREHGFDDADAVYEGTVTSKHATSNLIDALTRCPRKAKTTANPLGELADGIYRKDGVIYRVYRTVHGANRQVASRVNLDAPKDSTKKDKFTYMGVAPLRELTADDMLPYEEAVKIASAYEWCIACGTILHNDKSVELGIGPICRTRFR